MCIHLLSFCNKMEERYSEENVKRALRKWYGHGVMPPPREASIDSRLVNGSANTSVVLYKRRALFEFLQFPNHYYISVDGKVWHPGDPSEKEIFINEDSSKWHVMRAHEMCFHCTYHFFLELFERDTKFNLVTNNCQNVVGHVFETSVLILYHLSLIMFLVTAQFIFFVFGMMALTLLVFHQLMVTAIRELEYIYCPHIRKAY